MAIGRLVHYGLDAVLVSTVLAGVRRSSGFKYVVVPFLTPSDESLTTRAPNRVETEKISDPTLRSVADNYLGFGERLFEFFQGTAVNSDYFKRDSSR